jgi:hypothetical protein
MANVETTVGGRLAIDVVDTTAVADFAFGLSIGDVVVDEVVIRYPEEILVAPLDTEGRQILGSGGPAPEVEIVGTAVSLGELNDDLSILHSFELIPDEPGRAQVIVRFGGHERSFTAIVEN